MNGVIDWLCCVLKLIVILHALQFDNRGRNFLHVAIVKSDIESVLFLISVHADVNSRMKDSGQLAPLHLSVKAGSEIIVRNLVRLIGDHC